MATSEPTASELCGSIGRQIDLLMTLALAVNGGVAAAALQIVLHNSQQPIANKVILSDVWLVYVVFVLEGLAILLGYCARNALVMATRGIFAFDRFDEKNVKIEDHVPGLNAVIHLARWQFIGFIVGVLAFFLFMICNRHLGV